PCLARQGALATGPSGVGATPPPPPPPTPPPPLSPWPSSPRPPPTPASAALTVMAAIAGPAPEIKRRTSTSEIGRGIAPLRTWTPFTNELWVDSTTSVPAPQLTRIASAQNMTSDLKRTSAACYRTAGQSIPGGQSVLLPALRTNRRAALVMTSAAGLRYTQ